MIEETEAQRAEATRLKTAEPGPKPLAALKVHVVNSALAPGNRMGTEQPHSLPPSPKRLEDGVGVHSVLLSSGCGDHGPAVSKQALGLAGPDLKPCYLLHFIRLPGSRAQEIKSNS